MEPTAVTSQDTIESAPTWASLVGKHDNAGTHHVHCCQDGELHNAHFIALTHNIIISFYDFRIWTGMGRNSLIGFLPVGSVYLV